MGDEVFVIIGKGRIDLGEAVRPGDPVPAEGRAFLHVLDQHPFGFGEGFRHRLDDGSGRRRRGGFCLLTLVRNRFGFYGRGFGFPGRFRVLFALRGFGRICDDRRLFRDGLRFRRGLGVRRFDPALFHGTFRRRLDAGIRGIRFEGQE